ncbi:helix-turn-helix transcriptional regulator [Rhizobium ruizarguesonis]
MSTINLTLDKMSISPSQCRAARALIDLDQNGLAERASVSRGVIIDFEKGRRTPGTNNLAAIKTVLESAGIIFIDSNGNGPGVRLRDPS